MNSWEIFVEIFPLFFLGTWLGQPSHHQGFIFDLTGGLNHQRLRLAAIEPVMTVRDQHLFYQYLNGVNTYFEFGSGGSTVQAALRVSKVISVESDARWHGHLRNLIGSAARITWYTVDLKVPNEGWGRPGRDSPPSDWPNYTHAYVSRFNADLILIDGRFRVSCALCVFSEIANRTLVMIHDFCIRRKYWVVLHWYNLIKKGDTLAVLRKKAEANPPSSDLIRWYDKEPQDHPVPGLLIPSLPAVSKPSQSSES
jgi:hypothetical protein